MTQTFTEFFKEVRGPQAPQQEVRNSWGVYDYYKFYRKTKPKGHKYVLSESQYFAIIRKVNQKLGDTLLDYEPVKFPQFMGQIEILRKPVSDKIVEGRLKTNRFINWNATLKLWYEDKKAHQAKTLIYHEWKEKYRIIYNVYDALYTNKTFYEFRLNKDLIRRLLEQIKNGKTFAPYFIKGEENDIRGLYDD